MVIALDFILSKLFYFEHMETDPEKLRNLLGALQSVLKLGLQVIHCLKSKKVLSYAWLVS